MSTVIFRSVQYALLVSLLTGSWFVCSPLLAEPLKRADSAKYSVLLIGENPLLDGVKTDFRFSIKDKTTGRSNEFIFKREMKRIDHLILAGDTLIIIGVDPYSDFITDCCSVDLRRREYKKDLLKELLLYASVSPDRRKVAFDQFRPLHGRNEETDTSRIHLLETSDGGGSKRPRYIPRKIGNFAS